MSNLRIVTANVAGMNQYSSRQAAFAALTDVADVILFNETRCASAQAATRWQGELEADDRWLAHFTPSGTPYTGGTGIAVRRSVTARMVGMRWDDGGMPDGRLTRLTCMWDGRTTALVALYVPARSGQRRAFLASLAALPADPSSLVVVGGDFNCVTSNDDIQGAALSYLHVGGAELIAWQEAWGLVDAWPAALQRAPRDAGWTKFARGAGRSRIDRIYVSATAQERCVRARTVSLTTSDHRAVLLALRTAGGARGTRWRLNTDHLSHPLLQQRIVAVWDKQLTRLELEQCTLTEAWSAFKAAAQVTCVQYGKQGQSERSAGGEDGG